VALSAQVEGGKAGGAAMGGSEHRAASGDRAVPESAVGAIGAAFCRPSGIRLKTLFLKDLSADAMGSINFSVGLIPISMLFPRL
jgi:hypothetical protein